MMAPTKLLQEESAAYRKVKEKQSERERKRYIEEYIRREDKAVKREC